MSALSEIIMMIIWVDALFSQMLTVLVKIWGNTQN